MAKKKTSRLQELQDYAKTMGLHVATYSPGDGVTRYRFFDNPGPGQTYFGPASGMHTAWAQEGVNEFNGRCSQCRTRHRLSPSSA